MTQIITVELGEQQVSIGGALIGIALKDAVNTNILGARVLQLGHMPVMAGVASKSFATDPERMRESVANYPAHNDMVIRSSESSDTSLISYRSNISTTTQRFRSTGPTLHKQASLTGTYRLVRIEVDFTPTSFIDFMIDEEAQKGGMASNEFKSWLREAAMPVINMASDQAEVQLGAYVSVLKQDNGDLLLVDPTAQHIWHSPLGRVPWPVGPTVGTVSSDPTQLLRAYLDQVDSIQENVSFPFSPKDIYLQEGTAESNIAVAKLNTLVPADPYRIVQTGALGIGMDDLGFWYALLRSAVQKDVGFDRALQQLGHTSAKGALAYLNSPSHLMLVERSTTLIPESELTG